MSIPKAENGYLSTMDLRGTKIHVSDRSGQARVDVDIAPPEAARITINGVAVSLSGRIAASGVAFSPEGAFSGFLLWLNPDGTIVRYVRLDSADPARVCFSPDGTLWALVRGFQQPDGREMAQYDMLRHYDQNGRLLGTALPKSSVPRKDRLFPGTVAYFAASKDRLGIYFPASWSFL